MDGACGSDDVAEGGEPHRPRLVGFGSEDVGSLARLQVEREGRLFRDLDARGRHDAISDVSELELGRLGDLAPLTIALALARLLLVDLNQCRIEVDDHIPLLVQLFREQR